MMCAAGTGGTADTGRVVVAEPSALGAVKSRADEVLERRLAAFRVLYDTVCEVEGAQPDEVSSLLVENMRRLSHADLVAMALYDPNEEEFVFDAISGLGVFEQQAELFKGRWRAALAGTDMVKALRQSIHPVAADEANPFLGLFPAFKRSVETLAGSGEYFFSVIREGQLMAVGALWMPVGRSLRMKDILDIYLGVAGMILQRIRNDQALRRSLKEQQMLLASIRSGLIGLNADNQVMYSNEAAAGMFGFPADDIMGQLLDQFYSSQAEGDLWCAVQECRLHGSPVALPLHQMQAEDGREFYLAINCYPLEWVDEPGCVLIVADDVTERYGLEAELMESHKLESVGRLAAGVAHEINTPAQFINDNLRFLQEAYGVLLGAVENIEPNPDLVAIGEEVNQAIEQSREGIDRIAGMVASLKQFGLSGAQKWGGVDLNQAVRTAVTVARHEWKYVAKIEYELADILPPVNVDMAQLHQVLLGLVVFVAELVGRTLSDDGSDKGRMLFRTAERGPAICVDIVGEPAQLDEQERAALLDVSPTRMLAKDTAHTGLAQACAVVHSEWGGTLDAKMLSNDTVCLSMCLPLGELEVLPVWQGIEKEEV